VTAAEEDPWRLDSEDGEDFEENVTTASPIRNDDMRRSQMFNVGPTVRYSIDARQVIMGESK
jgi:hypothetical protein